MRGLMDKFWYYYWLLYGLYLLEIQFPTDARPMPDELACVDSP